MLSEAINICISSSSSIIISIKCKLFKNNEVDYVIHILGVLQVYFQLMFK